jgi:hypothetical protein
MQKSAGRADRNVVGVPPRNLRVAPKLFDSFGGVRLPPVGVSPTGIADELRAATIAHAQQNLAMLRY